MTNECPVDSCKDMTKAKIWNSVFRWIASLGIFAFLLIAILNSIKLNTNAEKSYKIQEKTLAATESISNELHLFQTKIMRKIRLMDYDGQRGRVYMNKLGKINGIDPIEIRPFDPPTYEDILNK